MPKFMLDDLDFISLKSVICDGNLEEVRTLLAKGRNVKLKSKWNGENLLHKTSNVEIAKELLLHGVNINASNKYGETPLDTAVKRKNFEMVKELLKQGAAVNTTNLRGNSPLNIAVKSRFKNLKMIKLLLEYGAHIQIPVHVFKHENPGTPLDNAISDRICAKLLIRYFLINNFKNDIHTIMNLDRYKDRPVYTELSNYLDDCICEIVQMKTYEVKNNLTLYELIMMKHFDKPCNLQLYWELKKYIRYELSQIYPIYHEIIMDKLKPFRQKIYLLKKVSDMQIYVGMKTSSLSDKKEKVILDPDSTYNIADYLPNNDIKNLIMAFDDSDLNSPNYTRKHGTQFGKVSTSCYHFNKRIKFE